MSRTRWWVIIGLLTAVALGVQIMWVLVLAEMALKLPTVFKVVLVFFPGAMAWFLPFGFAWLWKDEIRPSDAKSGDS